MKNHLQREEKKMNLFSFEQIIIIFFFFLGAMNFANRYYYCYFIAFLLFAFFIARIKIDLSVVALIILSFSFLLFGRDSTSSITNILKPFIYPLCYLMGRGFFTKFKNEEEKNHNEKSIIIIIVTISSGLFLHLMLNLFTNLGSLNRNTIDFWTKEIFSATGQSALACLPIAVIFAMVFSDKKLWQKILALSALLLILYYNLILAGRTIFIFIIVSFMITVCNIFFGTKSVKSDTKVKIAATLLLCFIAFCILYSYNIFNIKSTLMSSNFYKRFFTDEFNLASDARGSIKILYIKNMWGNFWGGGEIANIVGGYAHGLFLDTYDQAGVFAFIFVIIYILASLKNFWCCITDKTIEFKFRQIIVCIYVVSYIEFMIEPILIGMQWFFALFCLIDGAVRSYLNNRKTLLY